MDKNKHTLINIAASLLAIIVASGLIGSVYGFKVGIAVGLLSWALMPQIK